MSSHNQDSHRENDSRHDDQREGHQQDKSQDFYQFRFDANLSQVLQMWEVDGRQTKAEKISGSTFDMEVSAGGTVVEVVRTEVSRKGETTEVSIYRDVDGDQRFDKSLEIEVASANTGKLEQHRYTFDSLGNVMSDQERKGNGTWKNERIDADEHFSTAELNGVTYLIQTESGNQSTEFKLLRDDNGDGVWTQIAEGETTGLYLDSVTGTIDLVGIQSYLLSADGIVG